MEGKSVRTLKDFALYQRLLGNALRSVALGLFATVLLGPPKSAAAQGWPLITGAFLEPTQFALSKSLNSRSLRLQAGYGGALIGTVDSVLDADGSRVARNSTIFGLEGLIWSRLEALSEFRFPVETADYFFGAYTLFYIRSLDPTMQSPYRIRLSHISSHLVDGTQDSIFGGSSSHYSREFITLEKLIPATLFTLPIRSSIGIRYVFHQVTHVEPTLQVPVTIEIGLIPNRSAADQPAFLTLSDAGDPSGPSLGAWITLRSSLSDNAASDLYFGYLYGPSLEGNYALKNEKVFEIGMRLHPK